MKKFEDIHAVQSSNPTRAAVAAACMASMFYAPIGITGPASLDLTEDHQEAQIGSAYDMNRSLKAHDLKVEVHSGKAILTGVVGESSEKALAGKLAMNVEGIKSVDNQIVVRPGHIMGHPMDSKTHNPGKDMDDASITMAVKNKLLWSRYADGLTTDVDTVRGAVSLTGTADSPAAKDMAGRLALNTNGVSSVSNMLVVKETEGMGKPAGEAKQAMSDTWITAKVKSTFLYSRHVDGMEIRVETKKGAVTLKGHADDGAERDLAIELAQNVRGVVSVDASDLKV